jgi:hypothetical protein
VHPAHVALLAALGGFFLYVNLRSPVAGEDFALTPWPLGRAPAGLPDQLGAIAAAMWAQATRWNARLGEMLAFLFGALPPEGFAIANTAVLLLLVLVLFVMGCGRFPDWRRPADAFPLLVLGAALLGLLPRLGSLLFWRAGTLNHTWGVFVLLWYAVPFRLLASGRDPFRRTSPLIVAAYCAAGVPAGMTVESAGPIVIAWALLLAAWRRRDLPRWLPWATLTLAAGTALLLFAPSTTARRAYYLAVSRAGGGATGVALFVRRLRVVLTDHVGLAGGLLALLGALAACWLVLRGRPLLAAIRRRHLEEPLHREAAVLAVMVVTSLGALAALATIPYHSDQIRGAAFHWYLLFAAVAFLAGDLWARLGGAWRAAAAVLVAAALVAEMATISRAYTAYHAEASARHEEILRQRSEGVRDVVVRGLRAGSTRLLDTREQWSTGEHGVQFIARYYGVERFAVGERASAAPSPAPSAVVPSPPRDRGGGGG